MCTMFASVRTTAAAPRTAALSHARTHATKHATTWPAATKYAFYANFYAVDEATGDLIN